MCLHRPHFLSPSLPLFVSLPSPHPSKPFGTMYEELIVGLGGGAGQNYSCCPAGGVLRFLSGWNIYTHKRQPKQTQTHTHTDIRRFKQRANGQTGVGKRTRLTENGEQCNYTPSTAAIGDHNATVPEGSRPKQQKLQTIQSKSYNTFLAGIYKQVGGQTTGKPSRITRGSLMSWK